MDRVIWMNDILAHSPNNEGMSKPYLANILQPAFSMACGKRIDLFVNLRDRYGNSFDREKFFALSNVYNIPEAYYLYDMSVINQKSWDYLFSFINQGDLVIGIEMGLDLRRELSKNGIIFINFWFHSFKLFDDICFMLNTNDKTIFKRIKKYQIPHEKFELYANIARWKLSSKVRAFSAEQSSASSCFVVGQSMMDVSVKKGSKFLNITNFPEEIEKLGKEYGTIYYIPHPGDPIENHPQLIDFISARPYIRVLKDIPSYVLLCSPNVKMVVGISSSLLYEAQFFGKKVQYLYRPLFNIDQDFGENNYLSVYNDYLNPGFWVDVLEGFFHVNKSAKNVKLFDQRQSMLRGEVINNYHAYRSLDKFANLQDEISRIEEELNSLKSEISKGFFRRYVLPRLFNRVNDSRLDMTIRYVFGLPIYKRHGKNVRILGKTISRN